MAVAIDNLVRDIVNSFLISDGAKDFDAIILEGSSQGIPVLIKKIRTYLDDSGREDIKVLRTGEGYKINADHYLR